MASGIFLTTTLAAGTGAVTNYLVAPRNCVVANAWAFVSADPGAAAAISIKDGSVTCGVTTVANATAAGTKTAYTPSATAAYANNVFDAGDVITVTGDGGQSNSVGFEIILELDEFGQDQS